jgi:hypothetical protein
MPYQTATNPKTGEKVVLVGDEWKPYTQTATGPKGAKAYLVGSEWVTESQAPLSYPERVAGGVVDFAREVVNPTVGPYATAAAAGAALGAPFAGVGAVPGAAFGVAALTTGDIAASMYNVGRGVVGRDPVRTPSQVIRDLYPEGIMGAPTGEFTDVLRTGAEFAVPAQATARAATTLAERVPTGTTQRVVTELGRAPGQQTVAALGGAAGLETSQVFGAESPLIQTGATLLGAMAPGGLNVAAKKLGGTGYNIVEPVLPRGGERIRARAYLDAFDNDPMRMQAAIDMLESGMTPQQVALQTNNSNLAALIGTAKFANTSVRDMYAARDAAIQQNMANRLARVKADEQVQQRLLAERETELAGAVPTTSQRRVGREIAQERADLIQQRQREVVTPAYQAAFDLAPNQFSLEPVVRRARAIQADPSTRLDPGLAPNTDEILRIYRFSAPADTRDPMSGLAGDRPAPPPVPPQVTLEGADAIIKAINIDVGRLMGANDPASRMALRNLQSLRDSVDESIRRGVPKNARDAYANALNVYQTQIAQPFREGWVAKLSPRGRGGEASVPPTSVVGTALRNEDSAIRFVAAFRDSPDAMEAMRNGILGNYRKTVVKGGRVDPKAHRQFMDRYRAQLGIFDNAGMNVRPQLAEFGKRAMGLEGRRALLDDLASFTKEAEANLADVTPDVSATRVTGAVAEVPALRAVVDDINAAFRDQRQFNKLVADGQRAGAGVKGIVQEEVADIPSLLSRPAMLANFILTRVKGELDVRTAAQVAVDLINSNAAARAFSNALNTRRDVIGEYFFRPAQITPGRGVPAIAPGVVTNVFAEPAGESRNALAR